MKGFLGPLIEGFLTSGGLIVAIGAQNAFVLRQGLMKHQVFLTALFCFVSDSCLILLGVGGFGSLVTSSPILLQMAKWGGTLFLFWYGLRSFRSVFKNQSVDLMKPGRPLKPSLKEAFMILLAVSFLNPHVYLDTVVLIGSIGAQFGAHERPYFALGAVSSSCIWFFGLCYGARVLAPVFENPKAWKVLDFLIGCIMWSIALFIAFGSSL
jgi:L-lysine exporter family protein LysE/ArgO